MVHEIEEERERTIVAVTRLCLLNAGLAMLAIAGDIAHADGCILGKFGQYIPEQSQSAYIEWSEGKERLFVSTRTASEEGPSLWLLPIPSEPAKIVVEPVEKFPFVFAEQPAIAGGRTELEWCVLATLALDFPPAAVFALTAVGTQAYAEFGPAEGVAVHQRVEKLGMVVEVLTATSAASLEAYLRRRELPVQTGELRGLSDYIGKEFSFVCGWMDRASDMRARALRIDFPSPTIYYPLKPTSVYSQEVDTSIYIRGFAAPVESTQPTIGRCRYVIGLLVEKAIGPKIDSWESIWQGKAPRVELTRIELPRRPSEWTQDLNLAPARPNAIEAARGIEKMGYRFAILVQMGIGFCAGVILPLLCKRQDRHYFDYLYGMLAGGLVCFSILVPWLLSLARWYERSENSTSTAVTPFDRGNRWSIALAAPACLILLGIGWRTEVQAVYTAAAMLFLLLLFCCIVWMAKMAWSELATGRRGYLVGPLMIFAVVHFVGVIAVCHGIRDWLIRTT